MQDAAKSGKERNSSEQSAPFGAGLTSVGDVTLELETRTTIHKTTTAKLFSDHLQNAPFALVRSDVCCVGCWVGCLH